MAIYLGQVDSYLISYVKKGHIRRIREAETWGLKLEAPAQLAGYLFGSAPKCLSANSWNSYHG
jgi:hypothetical protein